MGGSRRAPRGKRRRLGRVREAERAAYAGRTITAADSLSSWPELLEWLRSLRTTEALARSLGEADGGTDGRRSRGRVA